MYVKIHQMAHLRIGILLYETFTSKKKTIELYLVVKYTYLCTFL